MTTRASKGPGVVALVVLLAVLAAGLVSVARPRGHPPGLDRAIAAQEAHTDALFTKAGVVGTAVGVGRDGRPVVKIYTRWAGARGLPASLDGAAVEVEATGEFVAQGMQGIGLSSGTERLITKDGFLYCTVGTVGALLEGAGTLYALSNAHVYANQGSKTAGGPVVVGANGDRILQPGRVDMQAVACGSPAEIDAAEIGRLWAYQPIVFSKKAKNRIDAAIARLSVAAENNTPDGLGTPSSTVAEPTLGQEVQKHGRTTGWTAGTVTGLNAKVLVRYDKGVARFVGQVVVQGSNGPFSAAGDSGALIMTSEGNQPVALLFAGSPSTTVGNPIQEVLNAFGMTILGNP